MSDVIKFLAILFILCVSVLIFIWCENIKQGGWAYFIAFITSPPCLLIIFYEPKQVTNKTKIK